MAANVQVKMDAAKSEVKKAKSKLKLVVDGLAQDITGLKRQVRPLIPALQQMLRFAGQAGSVGQNIALPGPEPVRKIRPKTVGTGSKVGGVQARSVGSSSSGRGNVMRTPFGQRDEDPLVNLVSILASLETIVSKLDGLNNKITGIAYAHTHSHTHLGLVLYSSCSLCFRPHTHTFSSLLTRATW